LEGEERFGSYKKKYMLILVPLLTYILWQNVVVTSAMFSNPI
jgi:hypothetical protein